VLQAAGCGALLFRGSEAGQASANEPREIGSGVGGFRCGVDERARFQLGERQAAGDQRAALEHEFVPFAIKQDAPVPRRAVCRGMLRADTRGAVARHGVVPARARVEFVERRDIVDEPLARFLRRSSGSVEIYVFATAKVCPDSDHVALIGDHINQLKLPEEAAYRRIAFADFFPRLDGKADRRRIRELEASNRVGHPWRAPVIDRQVDARELREAHRARLPVRCVVSVGTVVAVSDIVQRHLVAFHFSPCCLRHIGLGWWRLRSG
jgi:hypothetical protein